MKQPSRKCKGRVPGNILTSYPCNCTAREGSEYCYWHDPATEEARLDRMRRMGNDRRLEREDRERRYKHPADLM